MKLLLIFSFLLLSGFKSFSQLKKPELFVKSSAFVSAGKNAPFWLLSNQYGKYSNHWYNINYRAGAKSVFDTSKTFDYGYGVEIMNRIDDHYTIYPHEL